MLTGRGGRGEEDTQGAASLCGKGVAMRLLIASKNRGRSSRSGRSSGSSPPEGGSSSFTLRAPDVEERGEREDRLRRTPG